MTTNCHVQQCVFVVSFPRSGTHLLIDFIRRNFPVFNPTLRVWDSASNLYLRIDHGDWKKDAQALLWAGRSHTIVQTHQAGLTHRNDDAVRDWLNPQKVVYLYPFRKFSKTVKSFAEFMRWPSPIRAALRRTDPFFRQQSTVADCLRNHARAWLMRGAQFIDSDLLLDEPETTCASLGAVFGLAPREIGRRLPRHKMFAGKGGEGIGRLLGRESTEVVIRHRLAWECASEQTLVDTEFSDLYAELSERRIN